VSSIIAHVGHAFEVALYSHGGSTGYSWVLTALPAGAALTGVDTAPPKPGLAGGAERQTFTFLGIASSKGTLTFELLRSWEPDKPADKRSYDVKVLAAGEAAQPAAAETEGALLAAAGNESFPPIVFAACEGEHAGKVVLPSRSNCVIPYGFPANVKYGFPVTPLYAVIPPTGGPGNIHALYMVQPPTT
jgi:hypothetical protein